MIKVLTKSEVGERRQVDLFPVFEVNDFVPLNSISYCFFVVQKTVAFKTMAKRFVSAFWLSEVGKDNCGYHIIYIGVFFPCLVSYQSYLGLLMNKVWA